MTTVRDIITRALQSARIVSLGVTPKAKEMEYGLEILQSLYDHWATGGMLGRLTDYLADGDYDAEEGQRIRHSSAETITIPTSFDDGERQPYDLSVIETYNTTTSARSVKIWDRNAWVELLGLTLDSEAPLAARGVTGLSACVAIELTAFGAVVDPRIERQANRFKASLSMKFGADVKPREDMYF